MRSKVGRSWWIWGGCVDLPERDVRNLRHFSAWSLAWAISYVAATFLLETYKVPPGAPAIIVAAIPIALGLATVRAYVRYLREADELQRKIHLETLALGFGAGAVFMMGYPLLEHAGAPELDMNAGFLVMVMVWSAWQLVAARRYQ